MIQSTVADSLSYGLTRLKRERDALGLRLRIVLAIHDAVLLLVPLEELATAKALLRRFLSTELEVPGTGLHYGVDMEECIRWGVKLTPEEKELVKSFERKIA